MNVLSHTGFGPNPRRRASDRVAIGLGHAKADLATKLAEALIAADAIGLTGVGIKLDEALVELTGLGLPVPGFAGDLPSH